jgi:hypothetical protein
MQPYFLVSYPSGAIDPTTSSNEVCIPVGPAHQIISELGNSVKAFPKPAVAVLRRRVCNSMQNQ